MNSLEKLSTDLQKVSFCINLLTSGKLGAHLVEIKESAQNMKAMLIELMVEQERVRRMNNIRNRVEEVVNVKII